jgi:hypothetical protein
MKLFLISGTFIFPGDWWSKINFKKGIEHSSDLAAV